MGGEDLRVKIKTYRGRTGIRSSTQLLSEGCYRQIPLSTAPAALETIPPASKSTRIAATSSRKLIYTVVRPRARWNVGENNDLAHLSTSQRGITRGCGTEEDLYDPDTA